MQPVSFINSTCPHELSRPSWTIGPSVSATPSQPTCLSSHRSIVPNGVETCCRLAQCLTHPGMRSVSGASARPVRSGHGSWPVGTHPKWTPMLAAIVTREVK